MIGMFERYGLGVLLVLFIIPILPDEIICIAAGFSRVSVPALPDDCVWSETRHVVRSRLFGLVRSVVIERFKSVCDVAFSASLVLLVVGWIWRNRQKETSDSGRKSSR